LIQEVIISVNFDNISQEDLSNSPNKTNQNIEDTFSLYKAILAESKQTVKSNFDTISYSYTEENTAFIASKQLDDEQKAVKKQEKVDNELSKELTIASNIKLKAFRKKAVIG
jgi:hypothetical protein